MSKENVELVLRGIEAINAGDVEPLLSQADPEIRFIPRRAPVSGAYVGHDGLREFVADNAENMEIFRVTPEEVLEAGENVVVIGTLLVRGKGSGIEMTFTTATVTTVRNGKIVRFEEFIERHLALAAAGVAE